MATGIYKITCVPTSEFYIGLANDIEERWRGHRVSLEKDAHENKKLRAAWRVHGRHNFKFEILFECSGFDLEGWEAFYICTMKPAFNTAAPSKAALEFARAKGAPVERAEQMHEMKKLEYRRSNHRQCETCNATYKDKTERFCRRCRTAQLKAMRDSRYLQRCSPTPTPVPAGKISQVF